MYTVLSSNATGALASVAILRAVSYISNSLQEALPLSCGELFFTGTLISNEGDQ
jgi:hypothetical protein